MRSALQTSSRSLSLKGRIIREIALRNGVADLRLEAESRDLS